MSVRKELIMDKKKQIERLKERLRKLREEYSQKKEQEEEIWLINCLIENLE
jgi:hypothetical protein